jgi:hypothetical protein
VNLDDARRAGWLKPSLEHIDRLRVAGLAVEGFLHEFYAGILDEDELCERLAGLPVIPFDIPDDLEDFPRQLGGPLAIVLREVGSGRLHGDISDRVTAVLLDTGWQV